MMVCPDGWMGGKPQRKEGSFAAVNVDLDYWLSDVFDQNAGNKKAPIWTKLR